MGENSEIGWTDDTFNIVWGCTKVDEECRFCYAEAWAKRHGVGWGPAAERRTFGEKHWDEPRKWNRAAEKEGVRRRVFCSSMADVFEDHPTVNREREMKLWGLIRATPWLDWLLLTKRPENLRGMLPGDWCVGAGNPRPNVWLGTTTGHRKAFVERVSRLREIPAAVRFLSAEPLLEDLGPIDLAGIDWVIVGGESGHGARPMHPDWVRSIRGQCLAAGVAFFFKQWGEWAPIDAFGPDVTARAGHYFGDGARTFRVGKKAAGRMLDGQTWDAMPAAAGMGV